MAEAAVMMKWAYKDVTFTEELTSGTLPECVHFMQKTTLRRATPPKGFRVIDIWIDTQKGGEP